MAIAVLAVLLIVLVICVIVLAVFVLKLKMQLQANNNKNRWIALLLRWSFDFCYLHSEQQPPNAAEPAYEMIAKPDDVNMEKNPAYSVQDTSMLHHYDFVSENSHTKSKQWFYWMTVILAITFADNYVCIPS